MKLMATFEQFIKTLGAAAPRRFHMFMCKVVLTSILLVLSSQAAALRSTDIEAYLDPAYTDYQSSIILLVASGTAEFRKQIEKKANKRIAKKYGVTILRYNDIFVPTRQWNAEQMTSVLDELGVDSVLEITSEGYDSDFQRIHTGSTTYSSGSANIYGNNVYGSSTSTTSNNYMTFASDSAQVSAKLTDRANGNTVWIAGVSTKGSGTMMVGAGWTASSVISNLVKNWKVHGLLRKK